MFKPSPDQKLEILRNMRDSKHRMQIDSRLPLRCVQIDSRFPLRCVPWEHRMELGMLPAFYDEP